MSNQETSTVHFCSIPEIVEIPRRSIWQRKLKPFKDKCCSVCYALSYFLCYPCVEAVRFCVALCNICKGDDFEAEIRRDQPQRRDSHNLYAQGIAVPGMMYGPLPYGVHSAATIKPTPQFL